MPRSWHASVIPHKGRLLLQCDGAVDHGLGEHEVVEAHDQPGDQPGEKGGLQHRNESGRTHQWHMKPAACLTS